MKMFLLKNAEFEMVEDYGAGMVRIRHFNRRPCVSFLKGDTDIYSIEDETVYGDHWILPDNSRHLIGVTEKAKKDLGPLTQIIYDSQEHVQKKAQQNELLKSDKRGLNRKVKYLERELSCFKTMSWFSRLLFLLLGGKALKGIFERWVILDCERLLEEKGTK